MHPHREGSVSYINVTDTKVLKLNHHSQVFLDVLYVRQLGLRSPDLIKHTKLEASLQVLSLVRYHHTTKNNLYKNCSHFGATPPKKPSFKMLTAEDDPKLDQRWSDPQGRSQRSSRRHPCSPVPLVSGSTPPADIFWYKGPHLVILPMIFGEV